MGAHHGSQKQTIFKRRSHPRNPITFVLHTDHCQDIGDAEKRSLIEIKETIVRVQTAPAMDIIAEGKLERKEVQKELEVKIEKFDPNDPTLSEKVKERIDEFHPGEPGWQ